MPKVKAVPWNVSPEYVKWLEKRLLEEGILKVPMTGLSKPKTKRKLSPWNKFVKANSNKKKFQYANGKLKLKKMGIAYRKKRR